MNRCTSFTQCKLVLIVQWLNLNTYSEPYFVFLIFSGEGEFGVVYKGIYQNEKGQTQNVAIKRLNGPSNPKEAENFIREANIMMELDHHCIVHLIGISPEPLTM